jgi:hypothetical protein
VTGYRWKNRVSRLGMDCHSTARLLSTLLSLIALVRRCCSASRLAASGVRRKAECQKSVSRSVQVQGGEPWPSEAIPGVVGPGALPAEGKILRREMARGPLVSEFITDTPCNYAR